MRQRLVVGTVSVAGYAGLQWLGRTCGSTRAERHSTLPGDELCPDPQIVTTHATTIDAPPSRVWPWLVQMGWGRGQWYTARWVDRLLFPANGPSAHTLVPELQALAVGDRLLDGPPEAHTAFVVEQIAPNQHLVLHSTEHLPSGWAERHGATINWSWTFVLEPVDGWRTRLTIRTRVRLRPWWVTLFYRAVIVPADLVMSRQMLRGVRARAEATTVTDLVRLAPGDPTTPTTGREPTTPVRAPDSTPAAPPVGRPPAWEPLRPTAADQARQVRDVLADLPRFAAAPLLRPWHRRWGATRAEVAAAMPGDEVFPRAQLRATRAVTIAAPPEAVWPWLVQVGCLRAGWYADDLLDNLARPSARKIIPELQDLAIGRWVPMAPEPTDKTSFVVDSYLAPEWLLWRTPSSTWAWRLVPLPGGRTRLITRLRYAYDWRHPGWILLMELGDWPMMRRMLRGIRERAETEHRRTDPVRGRRATVVGGRG